MAELAPPVQRSIILGVVRALTFLAILLCLALLTGWTARAATPVPPKCSSADTKNKRVVRSGLYVRFCGPARARIQVRGETYVIRGGFCGGLVRISGTNTVLRWIGIGLAAYGPVPAGAPEPRAFEIVLESPAPMRPGPVQIIDNSIHLPEISGMVFGTGTAVLTKKLRGGTFWITARDVDPKGAQTLVMTGSWTCR
jgi:hypothetical protein